MQKKQDHILWTLESKKIDHEQIDIGDPNREKDREFMRENASSAEKGKTVLPPQIFNDETYVGVSTCIGFLDWILIGVHWNRETTISNFWIIGLIINYHGRQPEIFRRGSLKLYCSTTKRTRFF